MGITGHVLVALVTWNTGLTDVMVDGSHVYTETFGPDSCDILATKLNLANQVSDGLRSHMVELAAYAAESFGHTITDIRMYCANSYGGEE